MHKQLFNNSNLTSYILIPLSLVNQLNFGILKQNDILWDLCYSD